MKACNQDLRDRVIDTYKDGKNNKSQIARLFRLCYDTVCNWIKRHETTGDYKSKRDIDCGRQPKYNDKQGILNYTQVSQIDHLS